MASSEISIDVGPANLADGAPALTVKIQMKHMELNVWIATDELHLLHLVPTASWDERRSLRIGCCANSPAFWSSKDGETSILIGHDDETWDLGVFLPPGAFQQILNQIDAEQNAARDRVRKRGA